MTSSALPLAGDRLALSTRGYSRATSAGRSIASGSRSVWRIVAGLGLLLTTIGILDIALQWYPTAFRQPEWEFGTIAISLGSLPIVSLGLAALLVSFLATDNRVGMITMGVVLTVVAVIIAAAYMLLLLGVPIVLHSAPLAAKIPIEKSIVRSTIMTTAFGIGAVAGAITSFKHLTHTRRHG